MDGCFTYVGAGKAGACHDMAVLKDCQDKGWFLHPPAGSSCLAKKISVMLSLIFTWQCLNIVLCMTMLA